MAETLKTLIPRLGVLCRTGAVALIAGVWRGRPIREINASVAGLSLPLQAAVTGAVYAALFALALLAAQFGWIGILAFWLGVIVLVN